MRLNVKQQAHGLIVDSTASIVSRMIGLILASVAFTDAMAGIKEYFETSKPQAKALVFNKWLSVVQLLPGNLSNDRFPVLEILWEPWPDSPSLFSND